MHKLKIDFRIVDFEGSLEDITSIVGIIPSKVYRKGEPIVPQSKAPRKNDVWIIDSGIADNTSIEPHLAELVKLLNPALPQLKQISRKSYMEFSCCLRIDNSSDESIPVMHFMKEFNELVAELNAEIDIDIYSFENIS